MDGEFVKEQTAAKWVREQTQPLAERRPQNSVVGSRQQAFREQPGNVCIMYTGLRHEESLPNIFPIKNLKNCASPATMTSRGDNIHHPSQPSEHGTQRLPGALGSPRGGSGRGQRREILPDEALLAA